MHQRRIGIQQLSLRGSQAKKTTANQRFMPWPSSISL
jgi:hypothetical protein